MKTATRRWLDSIPIIDPVKRKQALLLQLILLGMIATNASMALVAFVIPGVLAPAERPLWAIVTPLLLVSYAAGVVLLRRGRFQQAILVPALILSSANGWWIMGIGLRNGAMYLIVFALPITIAGLLAGRRAMIALIVTSQFWLILALLFPGWTGFIAATDNPELAALLYCGVSALLGVCFHIFGFTLEDALKQALVRQRDLEELQATLEQRVLDRTAEANAARLAAEEANLMKSRFLANMSHELRTPLNAILNFTHFLRHPVDLDDESDRELYLERVSVNATHLLGLINDILDLSKIEAGKIELMRDLASVEPILRGVYATTLGLTTEKPIAVHLDLEESLPPVMIDSTRIRQVVLNLLSNAAKFTQRGTITLGARRRPAADGGAALAISVRDTGIGIAPKDLARIFEEFQQVQTDATREYQGTGLGLAISKRLIELHGGELTVESVVGQGSTFTITLPIKAGADDAAASQEPPPDPDGSPAPRILVIDDDPDAHRVFRRILEPAGYQVYAIDEGSQVLASVERIKPALIVLDIQLPETDGWAVLAQLRSTPPYDRIPVVLCTVVDVEQAQLRGLSNIKDYLLKPVNPQTVLEAVRRWYAPTGPVAIVEDDPDALAALVMALARADIPTQTAATGPDGLALIERTRPALVLLDLLLPGMDGFAILERLAEQPELAATSVIVITAQDLTAEQQAWLAERTVACLHKSGLGEADLGALVRHILDGSHPAL